MVRSNNEINEPRILEVEKISFVRKCLDLYNSVYFRSEGLRIDVYDLVSDPHFGNLLDALWGDNVGVPRETGVKKHLQALCDYVVQLPVFLREARVLRKGLVVGDPQVTKRASDKTDYPLPFRADPGGGVGHRVGTAIGVGAVYCLVGEVVDLYEARVKAREVQD